MLYLFQDRSLKINRKSAGENSVSVGGGKFKTQVEGNSVCKSGRSYRGSSLHESVDGH